MRRPNVHRVSLVKRDLFAQIALCSTVPNAKGFLAYEKAA